MRPVPLDDAICEALGGGVRRVLAGPDGDLLSTDVAAMEVLLQRLEDGSLASTSVWQLENVDLVLLAAGGRIVLTLHGRQPITGLGVLPPDVGRDA